MYIKLLDIAGWMGAIAGTRLSFNSDGDSYIGVIDGAFKLGDDDKKLLTKLVKAGPSHSKFMRMVQVWLEITAPLYWWKQMSTYSVGVTVSSESTMHTIHKKPFAEDMFSVNSLDDDAIAQFDALLNYLNGVRQQYLGAKDKQYWRQLIQLLPSSFLQKRIVNCNYQVLRTILGQRALHKLQEWHTFCTWIKDNIPYSFLITKE